VQAEVGLLHLFVEAVAFETAVAEERPDVALEVDLVRGEDAFREQEEKARDGEDQGTHTLI
jgi:hypothetical protein